MDTHSQMYRALRSFCTTIEFTGGVVERETEGCPNDFVPVADEGWGDLGAAYMAACEAIGRDPLINCKQAAKSPKAVAKKVVKAAFKRGIGIKSCDDIVRLTEDSAPDIVHLVRHKLEEKAGKFESAWEISPFTLCKLAGLDVTDHGCDEIVDAIEKLYKGHIFYDHMNRFEASAVILLTYD